MSHALDVNFLNPFIDGALHTVKVQCNLEARPGKIHRKGDGPDGFVTDIAGIIGITSPNFHGSISIAFPAETFLAIMGRMLGEKFETINKDLEDGAGEMTNIIFGFAKRVLNEKGYALEKALPSVVSGKGIKLNNLSRGPTLIVPFETEVGAFRIEIGIEPV